jgi:hypothetical protein
LNGAHTATRTARAVLVALLLAGAVALWLVAAGHADAAAPTTSSGPAATTTSAGPDDEGGTPWGILIGAAAALAGLAVVSVGVAGTLPGRRRPPPPAPAAATPVSPAPPPADLQPALPAQLIRPVEETCAVHFRPDPDRSRFVATSDDAPDVPIARSPGFGWRAAKPPPRRAAIVSAHEVLLDRLRAEGWTLLEPEPGDRWYERRLSRRTDR